MFVGSWAQIRERILVLVCFHQFGQTLCYNQAVRRSETVLLPPKSSFEPQAKNTFTDPDVTSDGCLLTSRVWYFTTRRTWFMKACCRCQPVVECSHQLKIEWTIQVLTLPLSGWVSNSLSNCSCLFWGYQFYRMCQFGDRRLTPATVSVVNRSEAYGILAACWDRRVLVFPIPCEHSSPALPADQQTLLALSKGTIQLTQDATWGWLSLIFF
jgi:hypothetical protein